MADWLAMLATGASAAMLAVPSPTANPECPREARPLPPDAVAAARRIALREAPRLRGRDARGARVVAAAPATRAERGGAVGHDCGRRVRRRTVVVDLVLPRLLPSASLSQTTFAIAWTGDGARVWSVLH